jgi:hypothetical protein
VTDVDELILISVDGMRLRTPDEKVEGFRARACRALAAQRA